MLNGEKPDYFGGVPVIQEDADKVLEQYPMVQLQIKCMALIRLLEARDQEITDLRLRLSVIVKNEGTGDDSQNITADAHQAC